MTLVHTHTLFTGGPADWIAAAAAILLTTSALLYLQLRRDREPSRYYPDLAWLRASMYFSSGLLLSWSLGVLQSLLSAPLITEQQLGSMAWISYSLFYLVVLWVGYAILWPRGTFTDGRRSHPFITSFYGLAWGLCHAQVFLCFWAVVEWSGLNSYWVAAISYLLLSAYNFAFHQFFWDLKVSPPHNYAQWNMKKVQYCHVPNLVLGLTWLAIWGNFGLWVLLQTCALMISAHAMRFPAWFDHYRGVAGETR